MSDKFAKELVQSLMPDMQVVDTPRAMAADSPRQPTSPGPSMAEFKRKYLGADADDNNPPMAAVADSSDVEVATVRPKQSPADPVSDPGPRAVIISKTRGMLGSQG